MPRMLRRRQKRRRQACFALLGEAAAFLKKKPGWGGRFRCIRSLARGRILCHDREREGERPPCNGCAGECSCRKAESALSPEAAKAARPSARRSSKVPGTGTENVMSLRFGNNEFHERFDWYAWSAPVYEGADAVLEALYARDFRKKRLKGVRVVGAARNMTREAFREYEKRSGHDRGPDGAARESDFRRFLNIPHSVMLCEPFILDFDDGTALEFHPGEGLSARMGWNLIPPSCTEGLNRPNFRPELLFTPYLAGRSLQRIFLREESSAVRQYVCSGGRVESSQKEGSVVRYVFCFSPDETLTATSDGSGWYELAFGTGGATALLPYRHVLSASLGVDQPLLCHGWCGEDDGFLICGEDPEDAGVSRNAAFSMDENVLEAYFLPFLERRFEPERNAREGWEAKGFDFYGRNDYGRSAVQAMLSDIRTAISALRAGQQIPLRKRLLEQARRGELPPGAPPAEAELPAGAVNVYERFLTRMEGLLKALPENCIIHVTGP